MCVITYTILFPAKWHQDNKFLWRRFDSMAVFLSQCHFQNLPLLYQNSVAKLLLCLAPPLLLWKTKTAWIKRNIHYVTLQCYYPGDREATQRNSSLPQSQLFDTKEANFENDIASEKMALESKYLHQNHWSWCHFAGKRIVYSLMHSLI